MKSSEESDNLKEESVKEAVSTIKALEDSAIADDHFSVEPYSNAPDHYEGLERLALIREWLPYRLWPISEDERYKKGHCSVTLYNTTHMTIFGMPREHKAQTLLQTKMLPQIVIECKAG